MPRRYRDSDVSVDRYEDRREYVSRGGGGGGSRYEERDYDEVDYRRSSGRGGRQRESETIVKEREEVRTREPPAFLREDYGRTTAGPVVLRARETEDFEFAPRQRRRSASPESEPKVSREEIIIRRDESEHRPPPRPRERDIDREEIIIRRDEREREPDRRPPPPRDMDREEIIIRRDEREREPERRPPPPRDIDREEIIIRRDEREREPERRPPRPRDVDRQEIISRRDEREAPPPPREVEREREEVIIRRDDNGRRVRYEAEFERDEVAPRRGPVRDYDREEIVIRRDESDDRASRYTSRRDEYASSRPKSHERERSRVRRGGSESDRDEIIIRRDEREGRNGIREREEIIIRRQESRSPSPTPTYVTSRTTREPPPAAIINAPAIHQEVITHHRHIDHGYEVALTRPRPVSRPPSPPSPPPPPPLRERSEERIEIHRTGERNGRAYDEDLIIDRKESGRRPPTREPLYEPPPREIASPVRAYDRDAQEEADYYNARAMERAHVGEAHHGSTRDWSLVDVPPGTRRVRMNGAGGGEQEITWQRYNGVRRSKFYPDGPGEEEFDTAIGRPAPAPEPSPEPQIGKRYGKPRDPTDGLWTEITKDLVVKEAIQQMGYDYEETDDFYYVIAYLRYEDIARLVGLSDDIKKDRKRRVKEMEWEARASPVPALDEPPPRLAIEAPPPRRQDWDREDERYIEREIVYRGGRPPPPPGWRR